jgi:hypothetical protein
LSTRETVELAGAYDDVQEIVSEPPARTLAPLVGAKIRIAGGIFTLWDCPVTTLDKEDDAPAERTPLLTTVVTPSVSGF